MPEYMKKENGDFDYSKFFMGLAVAIVFIMQQYHVMQLNDVKENVVPRAEFEERHAQTMNREDILTAINLLSERMTAIEEGKDK